ncbi:MAG: glycosyltransferase [Gemmatimonadota bacterium]
MIERVEAETTRDAAERGDAPETAAAPGRGSPGAELEIEVSVVVPVTERPGPLKVLYEEYAEVLRSSGCRFEFLFVLEPWAREFGRELRELERAGEPVRLLYAPRSVGEATLVRMGAERSGGRVVVTLPAYRRIQAAALPSLLDAVEAGYDLALARRWPRTDSWVNRLQNRAFHALLGGISGAGIHDVACGVRAMRREVLDRVPMYGDFSRFLPILAIREGFRVTEVECPQHPEDRKTRIYSPGVYVRRLIDLLGLFFLTRFTYKPLRFFGLVGSSLSVAGAGILGVVLVQRLGGQGLANRPLLLLGVLLLTLGVQAFALGLIGEIIVHLHASSGRRYRVRSSTREPEDGDAR